MFKKLLALCIVSVAVPLGASAQIVPNNSYSQMLVNSNAMLQNSISQTIASQARTNGYGGSAPSNYCSPVPPADLQRGVDGHVPPELQGDPRYQEWLRCQRGQNVPQAYAPANPQAYGPINPNLPTAVRYPTPAVARHLPIAVTDFKPVVAGHPVVEDFLRAQPFTKVQKDGMRIAFMEMTSRIAKAGRPNNLAAAMATAVCGAIWMIDPSFTDADSDRYYIALNDRLGSSPQLTVMSPLQKQNLSDALILQITVAKLLADAGQTLPQARLQSVQLAQSMLVQLTGSPTGQLMF